ncbi:MAG: hypothetical protein J07HN4v3_00574 [Halonotius sp. J07HN4]|nr:MAG: hypothetical protein J07HN4v3_00574 [Halonotius sp. J07HN4]
MNWRNVALYTLLGLGVIVAIQIIFSVIATIIGIAWAIASSLLTLAVVGAMLYSGFRLISWYRRDNSAGAENGGVVGMDRSVPNQQSRVDELKQRYADGELSDAEFERQLERELDGPDIDSINRERSREYE